MFIGEECVDDELDLCMLDQDIDDEDEAEEDLIYDTISDSDAIDIVMGENDTIIDII